MEILETTLSLALFVVMIYTGIIWLLTKNHEVRMDSSIIAYTLILWGVLYGVSSITNIEGEVLSNIAKMGFIMICLSQSLPLTVSYIRSLRRGDK